MSSFYDTLNINNDASSQDIKNSFRKLSLQFHPDRPTGNEEKFKELNEAYNTLIDPEKRKRYDIKRTMGHNGGMGQEIPIDILNMMFGGRMGGINGNAFQFPFGANQGNQNFSNMRFFRNGVPVNASQFMKKPVPIIKTVEITLEQAYTGLKHPIEVERWIQDSSNTKTIETETVYIDIPAGIDDNEIIAIREKGNIISDDNKGDLKIFIKIINATNFIRNGVDLFFKKQITLKESLCGFKFELAFLTGKTFAIDNVNGVIINNNYKKIIQNMGMKRGNYVGNLIISFQIIYPTSFTPEQRTELAKIL